MADASSVRENYDLIIVGGGLVGGSLAAWLAQERPELHILLVDAAASPIAGVPEQGTAEPMAFDPRVVALSAASRRLLESIGVWPRVIGGRACAYRRMHVWDAEGTASITFDADDLHQPALGHIVENQLVTHALHHQLQELTNHSGLSCLFARRIVDLVQPSGDQTPVRVTLDDGDELSASLLVAADGATSSLRALAGFRTRAWDYGQSAIVTTVRTEQSHEFTAWQRFQTKGPLAFLPLQCAAEPAAEEHYSSIVWSADVDEAERLMALDDAGFCRELGAAFEHRLGRVDYADKRVCVPLQQQHAVRYHKQRVVLVGDAAHRLHPLAGQGVNLGLRDALVLAEEIERACRRHISLTHRSILQRYERRRQGHNLAAMAIMEGFKRLFGAEDLTVRWLRNTGMSWVDSQGWLKRQLAAMAME